MKNQSLPPEALDLYLRGELSDTDRAAFEAELERDPALKSELNYHQELVAGFGVQRKNQLKNILQNTALPVGVGVGISLWQTQWFQWAVAGLGAGAVATTVWVATTFGDKKPDAKGSTSTEQVASNQSQPAPTPEPTPETPAETAPEVVAVSPAPAATPAATTTEKLESATQPSQTVVAKPIVVPKAKKETTPAGTADVAKVNPVLPAGSPDGPEPVLGGGDNSNSPGNNLGGAAAAAPAVTETVVKADPNYNFHYQYFGGKLYLYGKFDKGLYEVLDLTTKGGKSSYVYYQSTYYPVTAGTSTITVLEACKDKALITTLDKLRKGQR